MLDFTLISLAFISGIMAFFGPCGVAMLPAYISYLLGMDVKKNNLKPKSITKSLAFGIITTLGIISVYLFMGALFSFSGAILKPTIPIMGFMLGIILIALGIIVYFEKFPYISFYHVKLSKRLNKKGNFNALYAFGVGYAIAQLSCTLPIFLLVVSQALLVGNFIDGMLVFLIYGVGISLGMVIITIGTMISKEAIQKYINFIVPHMRKLTSLVLIGAGLYQIYFQIAVNKLFGG